MDLSTQYLGLSLKNPLLVSASPLTRHFDNFKRLEDSGVAAIVMHSLFEEQITRDTLELHQNMLQGTESYAESLSYFPEPEAFVVGPEEYLDLISRAKKAVQIPVIASLNGHTPGGWTGYALRMQEAGADAIELNTYFLATNPLATGSQVEESYLNVLKEIKGLVSVPVSVKLSPFFSSLAHMAVQLEQAGADGLVLFNRFYQPDIDLETLEVVPNLNLSTSAEIRLPLRWIAVLRGHLKASLAATSGIHCGQDALKVLMAGADAAMMCSALLKSGTPCVQKVLAEMTSWMEEHEYESVSQMKGSMSQKACADPAAFERANYMKVLQSYK